MHHGWKSGIFVLICALVQIVGLSAEGQPIVLLKPASDACFKAGWGRPARVDGVDCRALIGGRHVTVPLKSWWGKGLRPPEGKAFRAEIRFKDIARHPIDVEVFAGLPDYVRVHRIGGRGDGEWRTAHVPLPWDFLMRKPGTDRTELRLRAPRGADVPIARIAIVPGDPERDETRWAAETRDWVAREQAEKRAKAKLPRFQNAVIPEDLRGEKAVPFVRSWHSPIQVTSAPQEDEADAVLKLRMARNEIEPAQFGVYAMGGDLLGVTVELSPRGLQTRDGRQLDAKVELLAAEYAVTNKRALAPQRLWPAYPVDIMEGRSHLFLLRISTESGKSRAGRYTGRIEIRAEGVEAELPVQVDVLPFDLVTMKETGFRLALCCPRLLPAHEMAYLVRHNMIGLCFFNYALTINLKKKSRTDFDIDFTIPDDFMANAKKAGMRSVVYYLGGDPYGFPDHLHLERELYRRVHYEGEDLMAARLELMKKIAAAPDKLLPELRPLYKKWVRKYLSHAEEAEWPEIYLSPFDEPAKWVSGKWGGKNFYYFKDKRTGNAVVAHVRKRNVPKWLKEQEQIGNKPELICSGGADTWIRGHFEDSCAAIHEAWPKAKIYASIHHARPGKVFLDDVEIYCSDAIHEDRRMGDMVRATKDPRKELWLYDFTRDCGPPDNLRYIYGFFHAAFGTTGALCWAYNWGPLYDTSKGGHPSILGSTTPYGVAPQPDFEGMREAWDDRRYLETAKKLAREKGHEADAIRLCEALAVKAGRNRREGKWDNVSKLYKETGDREVLDKMRGKVADFILKLVDGDQTASR